MQGCHGRIPCPRTQTVRERHHGMIARPRTQTVRMARLSSALRHAPFRKHFYCARRPDLSTTLAVEERRCYA